MIYCIIYIVVIYIIQVSLQQCPQIPANSVDILNSVMFSGITIPGFQTFDEDAISYTFTYTPVFSQDNLTFVDSFQFRTVTTIFCGPAYTCCFLSSQPIIPNTNEEENWLVSDYYMTVAEVIQVQLLCDTISSHPVPDCRNTSRVYYYESDSAVGMVSAVLSDFSLATNSIDQTLNDELIHASFTKTKRGFYIGVMNNGYCAQISAVQIFYSICPSISINQLNSLPDTPVPRVSEEPTVFNLSCPVGSVSPQLAECYSNGSWGVPESVECECERGWSEVASSLSCVACPENSYKSAFGNDSECVACPEMSSTSGMTGSVMCGCDGGWYRSEEESVDMLCGRSPSAVRNIRLERGTTGSSQETTGVRVVWDEPVDVWNRSVSYNVSLYSDGLWRSGERSESLWYALSESELGGSSREYLLQVTSLNQLVVLSGAVNSVSVSFVSTFPEVANVSLRVSESGSELEWEYRLEGGVSELSFELNYTSIGGVERQERVNGCSLVATAVYRCTVTVIELNASIDIVLTLVPLSNETGDNLSLRFNLYMLPSNCNEIPIKFPFVLEFSVFLSSVIFVILIFLSSLILVLLYFIPNPSSRRNFNILTT